VWIVRYIFGQELQGDKAVQLHVFGFVDDTHSLTAQFLDDAVMRNGLAEHRLEILGPQVRQVNDC